MLNVLARAGGEEARLAPGGATLLESVETRLQPPRKKYNNLQSESQPPSNPLWPRQHLGFFALWNHCHHAALFFRPYPRAVTAATSPRPTTCLDSADDALTTTANVSVAAGRL
jgi:hypothetical protein